MAKEIVMVTPATIDLGSATLPLPSNWVLSGNPESRTKELVRSHDWNSQVVVWDCTPGVFKWHYDQDEVILVLSGEAIMINEKGEEVGRLGAGDMGFFPAGTTCTWRITTHLRKVAVLRETMWRPLGFALKVWKKFLRTIGLTKKTSLSTPSGIDVKPSINPTS